MGIVPVWGFQLALAITFAFLFRLNKALVIIAANISIPPMIPVILFLSHWTGAYWMGDKAQQILFSREITFEQVQNNFVQYILGSVTLAILAGIFFAGLTFMGLKLFSRKKT